jgi:hypothetical protein
MNVRVLFAHVMGVPVEETLPALAPFGAVAVAGLRAIVLRWRSARRD